MDYKRQIKIILSVLMLSATLWGCGAVEDHPESASSVTQPSKEVPAGGVEPDIHINVPPPSLQQEIADKFFEKNAQMAAFSPGLKQAISKNIAQLPASEPSAGDGDGDGDNSAGAGNNGSAADPQVFFTLMGGALPLSEDPNCDPKAQFLCLDAPRPPEGATQFYTIDAGVDVVGRIDLTQLAVFGTNDPIAVVSIFNNDTGGSATEILVMPADVQTTDDPDIGKFQTAAPLGGVGKFTIVISAYRNINDGEANELFSKSVDVFRTGQADIELVEAKTLTQGNLGDAVSDGDKVSAESLQLKVKLLTAYSPGIQVRFENYDAAGRLKGFSAVGHVSSQQPQVENGEWNYTGTVLLHQGKNEIHMVASNPQLEAQLGDQAPEPVTLIFTVNNYFGRPTLKVISPDPAQPLVAQTSEHQKVDLEFCYSGVPEKIVDGSNTNTDPEKCVTGSLGFEACLFVNGRKIGLVGEPPNADGEKIEYNPADGVFTAHITPDFGINLYQIDVTNDKCETALFTQAGAFVFGKSHPMVEDGVIGSEGLFTQRGVHVDIDKSFVEGEIKNLILKFVNRPETSDMVLKIFKKQAPSHGYTCQEVDPPADNPGDTSIEFIPDSFDLGSIELLDFRTASDGMLHVSARINGMHGEADMIDLGGPKVYDGDQLISFIPLTFSIARLDINLGVTFRRNDKGVLELDLKKISGQDVVNVVGDGPLGSFVSINTDRNPYAAGMKFLDQQQGLVRKLFNDTLNGTFLCGIESGLNHPVTGALGKTVDDLQNLQSKNPNIFRISIDKPILGKQLKLDVAADALRGDIEFDEEGIHLRNIPIRANPAASVLTTLAEEFKTGILGPVSRFHITGEQDPQQNITNSNHQLGLEIGEDVINQALFAAVGAGLLDLGIDAKFYKDKNIFKEKNVIPNEEIAPNAAKLAPGVDINRDGVVDASDEMTPVRLELRPDKRMPPVVSFLSNDEVAKFITEEEASKSSDNSGSNSGSIPTPTPTPNGNDNGSSPPDSGVDRPYFVAGQTYFRAVVANLEIAAYKQEFIPESLGGIRHYCKKTWTDDPSISAKGFCNISAPVLVDDNDVPNDQPACDDGQIVDMTNDNGMTLSHQSRTAANADELVPLYRIRMNAVVHGKISGISREVSAKEKLQDPSAPVRTFLHMQFAPSPISPRALIHAVEVIENNTNISDEEIISRWDTILSGAIGDRCRGLNELRIPIPDTIEFDPNKEGLIKDLGLTSLGLGTDPEQLPEAYLDDNRLYLDLLLFADLKFDGEQASSDDTGMGNP